MSLHRLGSSGYCRADRQGSDPTDRPEGAAFSFHLEGKERTETKKMRFPDEVNPRD